jgi:hypothetical protein
VTRRPGANRDAYRFLVALILATTILVAFQRKAGPAGLALQGGTLLFALWTSDARRGLRRAAGVFVLASIVVGLAGLGRHNTAFAIATVSLGLVLAIAGAVAVLHRIGGKLRIDATTVYGAMSVYLLIGLSYGYLYQLIALTESHPFFAGNHGTLYPVDYIYFSFITITTVGYGDFTPAGRVGEMIAASEAVIGQLYLVSVVGLVVGNFGRQRNGRAKQ